ncbi:hypothetical protein HK097_004507 [Rhizophlyctis rosea]|uniref:IPT/TIG domain-containing protein n=1 Tax=Rhizophlyctis rosea TaxID=64517 RepID=A0AAD5SFJ4_9FUNG|nr:hypothetical protein HK097_004507 [Rhizophlyctis rosea]
MASSAAPAAGATSFSAYLKCAGPTNSTLLYINTPGIPTWQIHAVRDLTWDATPVKITQNRCSGPLILGTSTPSSIWATKVWSQNSFCTLYADSECNTPLVGSAVWADAGVLTAKLWTLCTSSESNEFYLPATGAAPTKLVLAATADSTTVFIMHHATDGNSGPGANTISFTLRPSADITSGTITIKGIVGTDTADSPALAVSGPSASKFGSSGVWTQSSGTLVLTLASGQTLPATTNILVSITITNPADIANSPGVTPQVSLDGQLWFNTEKVLLDRSPKSITVTTEEKAWNAPPVFVIKPRVPITGPKRFTFSGLNADISTDTTWGGIFNNLQSQNQVFDDHAHYWANSYYWVKDGARSWFSVELAAGKTLLPGQEYKVRTKLSWTASATQAGVRPSVRIGDGAEVPMTEGFAFRIEPTKWVEITEPQFIVNTVPGQSGVMGFRVRAISAIPAGTKIAVTGYSNITTISNPALPITASFQGSQSSPLFGSSADWDQSKGTITLTTANSLPLGEYQYWDIKFTLALPSEIQTPGYLKSSADGGLTWLDVALPMYRNDGGWSGKRLYETSRGAGDTNAVTIAIKPRKNLGKGGTTAVVGFTDLTNIQTGDSTSFAIGGTLPKFWYSGTTGTWTRSGGVLTLGDKRDFMGYARTIAAIPSSGYTIASFNLQNAGTAATTPSKPKIFFGLPDTTVNQEASEELQGAWRPSSPEVFRQFVVAESTNIPGMDNVITITLTPVTTAAAETKFSIKGFTGTGTSDSTALPLAGVNSDIFGNQANWVKSEGRLDLTIAAGKSLPATSSTFTVTLKNSDKPQDPADIQFNINGGVYVTGMGGPVLRADGGFTVRSIDQWYPSSCDVVVLNITLVARSSLFPDDLVKISGLTGLGNADTTSLPLTGGGEFGQTANSWVKSTGTLTLKVLSYVLIPAGKPVNVILFMQPPTMSAAAIPAPLINVNNAPAEQMTAPSDFLSLDGKFSLKYSNSITTAGGLITLNGWCFPVDRSNECSVKLYSGTTPIPCAIKECIGTRIVCEAGEGAGKELDVAVKVGSDTRIVERSFSYPPPAIFSEVLGPESGGLVTIVGKSFGAVESDITVKIGDTIDCEGVKMVTPHTKITCTVPAGAGSQLWLVMTVKGQTGGAFFTFTNVPIQDPDEPAPDVPAPESKLEESAPPSGGLKAGQKGGIAAGVVGGGMIAAAGALFYRFKLRPQPTPAAAA